MSSTELGTALQVRPYVAADEPAVLALLVGALGEGPSGARTPDFFRWKHLENPFGESLLLVAELDGEIVGLRAFLRWGFTLGDRSLRAVRAVDTATREDQRGKGIFSTLTKAALAELRTDTDLVFNTPNGSSRPGYLKMGWQEVGRVPVWIKVRRPVAFARGLRSATSVTTRPAREIVVDAPLAAAGLGDDADLRPFLEQLDRPADRLATPYTPEYLDLAVRERAPRLSGDRHSATPAASRGSRSSGFALEASSGRPRSRRSSCGPGTRPPPRTSSIAWRRLRPWITSPATSRPAPPNSPPRGVDGSSGLRRGTSSSRSTRSMRASISSRTSAPGPCPPEPWRCSDEHVPDTRRDLSVGPRWPSSA